MYPRILHVSFDVRSTVLLPRNAEILKIVQVIISIIPLRVIAMSKKLDRPCPAALFEGFR